MNDELDPTQFDDRIKAMPANKRREEEYERQPDDATRAARVRRVDDRLLRNLWILVETSNYYWNRNDRNDWTTPDLHYRYDLVLEAMAKAPRDEVRVMNAIAEFLERIPNRMKVGMCRRAR